MPRMTNQVMHEMTISGSSKERVMKDLARRWDINVNKYGVVSNIVIDKPFTLWNMRRPNASMWDSYFIRSPFDMRSNSQNHWTKINRQMWGVEEDVYDVDITIRRDDTYVITFFTDGPLEPTLMKDYFKHYHNLEVVCTSTVEGSPWAMLYTYKQNDSEDFIINRIDEVRIAETSFVSDPSEVDY